MTVGALAGAGTISLFGAGGGTPIQAELNVLSAAPETLGFNLSLSNDALVQYASGQIGTIASGDTLTLSTALAQLNDAGGPGPNNALDGLTENDGTLKVIYGATVAIAGNLKNVGFIDLDNDGYTSEGGSSFTVAGTLTNSGGIGIGPTTNDLSANTTMTVGALAGTGAISLFGTGGGTPIQAELNVLSAAPGTLSFNLSLSDNSLLEYAGGEIGTIASGVTLALSTDLARIADAGATTSNSALTGLSENDGTLKVIYGAVVAIAGNLADSGFIDLDNDGYTPEGGSSLSHTAAR